MIGTGWTAGNWVMLPQLLAACAHAQGETAARPDREHTGWCNVNKWKFCPVQTVRTEDKVWACNGVRRTADYIQYVCFKCLSPKNIAFLKHAIRQESEQLLSLVLSNRQTFSAKSLPWQEGPEWHEKLKVQGSWTEERETKERKGIPPVNHM